MFETDYSGNKEYSLVPPGKYECIIHSAFVNAKGSGIYFQVVLIVRNDVAQSCRNRRIFHAIWQKKPDNRTADDMKTDGFSYKQIMNLCQSAGLPSGKKYADINALGADLVGKIVEADVVHEEWNGRTYERIKWLSESKHPNCQHQMNEVKTPAVSGGQIDILTDDDDGDLPF